MTAPGQLYDTGVGTIGGRGQQATMPFPEARHLMTMTITSTHVHEDHFVTAEQAIEERIARLRESHRPFTRDGMRLTYTDSTGAVVTLAYGEPA
jgi:hypothetical protein